MRPHGGLRGEHPGDQVVDIDGVGRGRGELETVGLDGEGYRISALVHGVVGRFEEADGVEETTEGLKTKKLRGKPQREIRSERLTQTSVLSSISHLELTWKSSGAR